MGFPKKLVVAFEMGASHFGINTFIPDFFLSLRKKDSGMRRKSNWPKLDVPRETNLLDISNNCRSRHPACRIFWRGLLKKTRIVV